MPETPHTTESKVTHLEYTDYPVYITCATPGKNSKEKSLHKAEVSKPKTVELISDIFM